MKVFPALIGVCGCAAAGTESCNCSPFGAIFAAFGARFCVPCVTLETLARACDVFSGDAFEGFEVCQVSVAKDEETGPYHLMRAQNPVFLISARGIVPKPDVAHVPAPDDEAAGEGAVS